MVARRMRVSCAPYRRIANPRQPMKQFNMNGNSAPGSDARDFLITGTGDIGQALVSAPSIVAAVRAEYALEEALIDPQARHDWRPPRPLRDESVLRAAAATSADRAILPDDVFLAISDEGAVVGPRLTADTAGLWRGRRIELRAAICAAGQTDERRKSYTLSIYHLAPGDRDASRQTHLNEPDLIALLGSTLEFNERTRQLQPDGVGLLLLAAHGRELVGGLARYLFQIQPCLFPLRSECGNVEECSSDGLTRPEHFAEVSRELYRAGTVSNTQVLAAYREMQMLQEAQMAVSNYLVGGKILNLAEKGLRPPRS